MLADMAWRGSFHHRDPANMAFVCSRCMVEGYVAVANSAVPECTARTPGASPQPAAKRRHRQPQSGIWPLVATIARSAYSYGVPPMLLLIIGVLVVVNMLVRTLRVPWHADCTRLQSFPDLSHQRFDGRPA
jgi:hypothetical protein